jgi:hypothetical protein
VGGIVGGIVLKPSSVAGRWQRLRTTKDTKGHKGKALKAEGAQNDRRGSREKLLTEAREGFAKGRKGQTAWIKGGSRSGTADWQVITEN